MKTFKFVMMFTVLLLSISYLSMGQNTKKNSAEEEAWTKIIAIPETLPQNVPQSGHIPTGNAKVNLICSYSPDGKRFVTGARWDMIRRDDIKIWDAETKRVLIDIHTDKAVYSALKWSPDGRFIISNNNNVYPHKTNEDGYTLRDTVEVWDSYTGKLIISSGTDGVYGDISYGRTFYGIRAALSPDSRNLVTCKNMRHLLVIKNMVTGETKEKYMPKIGDNRADVTTMAAGPVGTDKILIGTEEGFYFYSIKSGSFSSLIPKPVDYFHPHDIVFSPDGKYFAVSLPTLIPNGEARKKYTDEQLAEIETNLQITFLYNTSTNKLIGKCKINAGYVVSLRFSPDSKQLLVESSADEITIFDVATGKAVDTIDLTLFKRELTRK